MDPYEAHVKRLREAYRVGCALAVLFFAFTVGIIYLIVRVA